MGEGVGECAPVFVPVGVGVGECAPVFVPVPVGVCLCECMCMREISNNALHAVTVLCG